MSYLEKTRVLKLTLGYPRRDEPSEKGELEFNCPFCDAGRKKHKMGINLSKNAAHCWVCEWKGSVYSLLRKIGAPNNLIEEYYRFKFSAVPSENREEVSLPEGFKRVIDVSEGVTKRMLLGYLQKRNLSFADIDQYNIGYTVEGDFGGRIIIPSYDKQGSVNYLIARTINPLEKKRYMNPHVSKNDIIFNELYVNWFAPVVLVEGVFDHLVTPNSVPLLGKEVHPLLLKKLMENGTSVILMLDGDKEGQKAATEAFQLLQSYGVPCTIVPLPEGKDPSELGTTEIRRLIYHKKPTTFRDLILRKCKKN